MTRRMERVNFTLRKELGSLIAEEVSDPRLAELTSITSVDCASDLGKARVYVTVLGDEQVRQSSLEALRSASGRLRNLVKRRVRMRRIPALEFMADSTIEDGAEILALIDRVKEEDQRRSIRESAL